MGLMEELRWTAAKLVSVGKLAVDSAVTESLKGGLQVYGIVKDKVKGKVPWSVSNENKSHGLVVVEEMQAKVEKMRREMSEIEQQNSTSAVNREVQELWNKDPVKLSVPEVTSRKKIFIRSRL